MIANSMMLLGTLASGSLGQAGATYAGVLVTGAGTATIFGSPTKFIIPPNGWTGATFQWVLKDTAGNCSATALIQVSNDGVNWITALTTTFASLASPQTDGGTIAAPWVWVRANVTAIAGTNASIYCVMGVV